MVNEDAIFRRYYLCRIGYFLGIVCLVLYVLDRQVEYTSRTDFLWQSKLKIEQDQVETMRGINKILLENILPAHVAEHFLTNARATQVRGDTFQGRGEIFSVSPLGALSRKVQQYRCNVRIDPKL